MPTGMPQHRPHHQQARAPGRKGKRHPTLGNRVQVGAFSRILGDIRVDDDVFIHPHSVVLTDVSGKEWSAPVRKAGGA